MRSHKQVECLLIMLEARIAIYATLATVIIALITALLGLRHNNGRLNEISVHVDGQYDDMKTRVAQLIAVLKEHGIDIPAHPVTPDKPLQTVISRPARAYTVQADALCGCMCS
jgi:uncharacterized protein YabE (DUF348 family)